MIHAVAIPVLSETRRVSPANLRILGITLGSSTTEDIKRILDPAADTLAVQNELSQICYASSGFDGSILEFVMWGEMPVRFGFFRAHPGSSTRCTRTSRISDGLETEGVVRLGMDRS